MSINYLTTPKQMREYMQRPPQLELSKNNKINKINNKRKFDKTDDTDANTEQNRMHPLRNNAIYRKLMLLNKKEKIDKTIFTPKIVSGILVPTLPKGFMRIPDYDYEEYDADYEDDNQQDNLLMLAKIAEVITNLENL